MRATGLAPVVGALLLASGLVARGATPAACDMEQDFSTPQWRANCDRAISWERDPEKRAELLQRRAYVAVEQYRYDDALVDLNAAVSADPNCATCLHERAYLNSELGEYGAAIADLDHEIKLRPDFAAAYRERAFARAFNGDLEGAYQDRVREVEFEPQSADSLLARGKAALWLGRFDDAAADFTRVETLAKAAGDEELRADAAENREAIGLWSLSSGDKKAASRCVMRDLVASDAGLKALIGDCTQAFLEAKKGSDKADALTTRSSALVVLDSSWDRATVDTRIAAGLDPTPDRYINLGFAYISVEHSRAAIQEFNRALAKGDNWLALAGRASARHNIDDTAGAEADALASMKLKLNEAAAWVLGDIAYERGEKEKARGMYLAVYQMGSRDDRLIARLKELGVSDPAKTSLEASK